MNHNARQCNKNANASRLLQVLITTTRTLYRLLAITLLDGKQLDLEVEGGSLGDSRDLLVSVGQVGRDGQLSLTPDGHTDESLIPTLDDLSSAEGEGEGGTAGVGVELLAAVELADVSGISKGWRRRSVGVRME